MKPFRSVVAVIFFLLAPCWLGAAEGGAAAGSRADPNTTAAAATTFLKTDARASDLLEHLVDSILGLFDIRTGGNTPTHYAVSALLLIVALLARRIVTRVIFPVLQKLAAKTTTTLDDKLFPALEGPAAAFVMVVGIFSAFKVLKLSPEADFYIGSGSQVAYSLVLFWGLWRGLSAVLAHTDEMARERGLGIAAFMPWIRKSLLTVFAIVAVLLTVQSLGFDVKAILAGLGIGGLAFALAAQDTLANIFGAVVVAVDQPFKLGEVVRIGSNIGAIEDIGLRSTRIRLLDKSLMVIPNKTVASDTITNLSRFTRRRFEQVIGLTYGTTPEQMNEMVEVIRGIIQGYPGVDSDGVLVFFRDFGPSSLDIWVVYEFTEPEIRTALAAKQAINVAIMQAVTGRGLSFAFPTQTVELTGAAIEKMAARGGPTASRDS